MAMTGGTVTLDVDGAASGGGLARAIYDAILASPALSGTTPTVASLQANADMANILGSAIVGYLQANAVAHVTTQVLGRTPNPNDPDVPIAHPTSAVDIPIT